MNVIFKFIFKLHRLIIEAYRYNIYTYIYIHILCGNMCVVLRLLLECSLPLALNTVLMVTCIYIQVSE